MIHHRALLSRARAGPALAPVPEEPLRAGAPPSARAQPRPRTSCACGGGCPGCAGPPTRGAAGLAPGRPMPPEPGQTGLPIPAALRDRAEAELGLPLGAVRLTTEGPLAETARARGADAAAAGRVVAFPGGLPDLSRPAGRFALGHELAHLAAPGASGRTAEAQADAGGHAISGLSRATGAPGASHPGPARHQGQPVHFGIFDPLIDFANDPIGYSQRALPHLAGAASDALSRLPERYVRLLLLIQRAEGELGRWLGGLAQIIVSGGGPDQISQYVVAGLIDGAFTSGEVLAAVIDAVGVNEFAHALFVTSGALTPLSSTEITASQRVHPPGLIPYASVLVDRGGIVARISALSGGGLSIANQLFGATGVVYRSVTTMHVIHTGGPMSDHLAVHELTHVAQYEMDGAAYMAQALQAQLRGQGYDYTALHGSLGGSIAAGASFASFNREQQAQICEDYYMARFGATPIMGGAFADLEFFVQSLWAIRGAPWPAGGP